MNKVLNYLYAIIIAIAGYCLFAIKVAVQDLGYQLTGIHRQVDKEQSDLNILKAEFAYLSSPKRLKALADNHLALNEINARQISRDPLVYNTPSVTNAQNMHKHEIKLTMKKINWRYKSQNKSHGIHSVAHRGN